MGLNDLRNVKIDSLIGCKLTAQEAFVFLGDLQNILAIHHRQDLPQVRFVFPFLISPPLTRSGFHQKNTISYSKYRFGAYLASIFYAQTTHLNSTSFYSRLPTWAGMPRPMAPPPSGSLPNKALLLQTQPDLCIF